MTSTDEEKQKRPLILDIKGNSLDDGPGIRSVIFFKGCPLSCAWCHNPESKSVNVEISFDPKECIGCNTCLSACAQGALSKDNPFYIDRKKCTLCFACVDVCPSGALSRVGREMSVGEIVSKVLPDKPFFDTSGGGVTLSGGEPTLFVGFVSRLLAELKAKGIRTLVETCGQFDFERFMDALYPNIDIIYYDIKLFERHAHERYCGASNVRILDNFARLCEKARTDEKILLPRIPLIPDITDTEENMSGIAGFLRSLGVKKTALMAYNPLWHEKCGKIGADDPWRTDRLMSSWPAQERMTRCREIFKRVGIES